MAQSFDQTKFVPRVEMAIMQYVIVSKAQQGGITKENLQQTFKGNLQMSSDHLQHCIDQLVEDGHIRQSGNKYEATDDGREDVQKLQNLVLELPNVVQQAGGIRRQGQQATTGGAGAGSPRTGGAGNVSGSGFGSQNR